MDDDQQDVEARPDATVGAGSPASRQVAWLETYRFAEWAAQQYGIALDHRLIAGTPEWCALPDDDARKLLALLLGGVRDALRNDAHQTALADASRAIAGSTRWRSLARRHDRGDGYIPRKAS